MASNSAMENEQYRQRIEVFLDAFYSITSDNSDEITADELEAYMKQHGLDASFVDKWLEIFDEDNDGTISLGEFFNTLGLEFEETRFPALRRRISGSRRTSQSRGSFRRGTVDGPLLELSVVAEHMPKFLQDDIVDFVQVEFRRQSTEHDLAHNLKARLDRLYGSPWHVFIMAAGEYGSSYTYESGCSFHFLLGRYMILVFKTEEFGDVD